MSRNYYSEIHLHLIWRTKHNQPLLTPAVEALVHRCVRGRLVNTPGAFVHAIGGTPDHVHVVVSVVPTILISDLVGQLKGASSHEANQRPGGQPKRLEWQAGYGVVSFGTKDLEWVQAYVRNQKEHHAQGTIQDRLERMAPIEDMAEAEQREAP
jgi:putative transposase